MRDVLPETHTLYTLVAIALGLRFAKGILIRSALHKQFEIYQYVVGSLCAKGPSSAKISPEVSTDVGVQHAASVLVDNRILT